MFDHIDAATAAFSRLGVRQGDVVALMLPNIPEIVYCMYALNKLGAISDMIDLRTKGDTLVYYLQEASASVAVICDLFAENVCEVIEKTPLKHVVNCSPFDSLPVPLRTIMKWRRRQTDSSTSSISVAWSNFISVAPSTTPLPVGKPHDTACIFHTSGTTGLPKGVMMTNLNFNAMALQGRLSGLQFYPGKRIMNQVPPFLAFNALCSTHFPLVQHMQIVLLPEYRPDKFAENIVRTKATVCLAGPADWGNFLENKRLMKRSIDLSQMVSPISGSDAMSSKMKADINEVLRSKGCQSKVLEGYGMTEIGAAACTNLPQYNNDASVGIPLPFNTFCVYDNEIDTELPYGETGEICMTGPTVMKGYYNHPEETAAVLRLHQDGKIWLHSGDLGHMDEAGCVFLEGRLKRIIVWHNGIKASPFAAEKAILKHNNVNACCVVGAPDAEHGFGQVPVAFIVLKSQSPETLSEIKKICESELSANYIPRDYRMIDRLPLTANGKVDYRTLEKLAEEDVHHA